MLNFDILKMIYIAFVYIFCMWIYLPVLWAKDQ